MIDHDATIHSLRRHAHPLAPCSHFGRINRRDIEILRRHSVGTDGLQTRIANLLRKAGSGAKFDKLPQQTLKHVTIRTRDADLRAGRTLPLFAELKAQYLKASPALDSQFQRSIKKTRIKEVSLQTKHAINDIGLGVRSGSAWLALGQRKTLGSSARLEKFRQGRFENAKAGGGKTRL